MTAPLPTWLPKGRKAWTRDAEALKRELALAYVQHRMQQHADRSGVLSVRRYQFGRRRTA